MPASTSAEGTPLAKGARDPDHTDLEHDLAVAAKPRRATSSAARLKTAPSRRSTSATGQRWMRLAHVYTSMIALLVVLFFGVTGLTLNHPSWTLGFDASESTTSGTLPADTVRADGTVEFLRVSEYLRSAQKVHGEVADFGVGDGEGTVSYRGPGYAADARFSVATRAFELTVEKQGFVGVMNDLHKGRDTNPSWAWLIDVSAVFLVVIALSGLGLQLFLRRRRRAAVVVATVGGIALVALVVVALV